jgi:hypothetical protein
MIGNPDGMQYEKEPFNSMFTTGWRLVVAVPLGICETIREHETNPPPFETKVFIAFAVFAGSFPVSWSLPL